MAQKKAKATKQTLKVSPRVAILVLVLVAIGIGLAVTLPRIIGDQGSSSPGLVKNRQVSVAEAYQLYQEGIYVLDVRTPIEYQSGHLPDAVLIPLEDLALRSGELPVGEPILIYCRTGNRSLEAMNMLGSVGFMNLSSMDGGITDWVKSGYPIDGGF